MDRVPSAPWLLSLSLMWFGWGAVTTTAGVVVLFAGTAWVAMLFLRDRTPKALGWFTSTWALGWAPVFVWQPWFLLAPASMAAVSVAWRRRRRGRIQAALAEFHRLDAEGQRSE